MRRTTPETIIFRAETPAEVLAAMSELARGTGWIILQPGFDPEHDAAVEGGLGARGRGATVAKCSWVPGERSRRRSEYVALGLEHGAGPKVARRLSDLGVAIPEPWAVIQDHPRRGLVVAAPPDEPDPDILQWLLRAGDVLSSLPLTGEWRAVVYRR